MPRDAAICPCRVCPADPGAGVVSGCWKIPYATKATAKRADRSFRSKVPMDAYLCPRCGSWHLTTKSRSKHPGANRGMAS